RLKNPNSSELANIPCVDLIAQKISGLIVVAVGMKKVVLVAGRGAELLLRLSRCGRGFHLRPRRARLGHADCQHDHQTAGQFPTRHLESISHFMQDQLSRPETTSPSGSEGRCLKFKT